jgi:hypothetical protein
MSQSCDLFYEGPQKHHPHALGLDELIGHFPWLLLCASALSIRTSRPFGSPLGRLAACLMRLFVSDFYRGYKNSSVGLGIGHLLICYCRT